jgi:hypothetical protein
MPETPLPAAPDPKPAPRPRKRWWLRAVVAVVVIVLLVVLLVLLAPTLLSTPPARSLAIGIVNRQLNGKVEVGSWSLGWFSGIEAGDIRVLDANQQPLAELKQFSTGLTLLHAITGRFALGKTTIDGLRVHARMNSGGIWNFSTLAKPGTPAAPPAPADQDRGSSTEAATLPNVSGEIVLTDAQATVEQPGKPTMTVPQMDADLTIPDINSTITDKLEMAVQVAAGAPGKIVLTGTADAIKNNRLASDSANLHQQLEINGIDLQAMLPLLPPSVGITSATGLARANAWVDVANGKSLTASLTLTGDNLKLAGPALHGDTYTSKQLSLKLPNLTGTFPAGLADWQSGRLQTGAAAQDLSVTFDQGSISASVDAVPQALLNLTQNQKPGAVSHLSLNADVDLARLAAVLSHSLQLANGLTLTSGTFKQTTTVTTDEQKATLASTTDLANLAGTRTDPGQAPRPVALHQPIHLDLSAADFAGNRAIPDLRDLHLNLASSFATGNFAGATLAAVQGQLVGHFQQVQAELGQFVQMDPAPLGGDFSVMLASRGDLTTPASTATLTAITSVNNFTRGTATHLPWAALTLSGDLHRGSGSLFVQSLQNGALSLQSGNPQAPTTELAGTIAATFGPGPATSATSAAAAAAPAPGIMTGITDAKVTLTAPSLPALQQLARTFTPPAAAMPAASAAPTAPTAAPATLTSGALALQANLYHQDATLLANITDLTATNVAFTSAGVSYQMKPVHLQLSAAIDPSTSATPTATMMASIHQIRVTKLTGDLGVATLSMPTPITLTDLSSPAPTATGTLQLGAKLEDVAPVLAALQGKPASAYPYTGALTTTQQIKSEQGTLGLDGSLQIARFQVLNPPAPKAAAPSSTPLAGIAALAGGAEPAATPAPAPVAFSEDQLSVADSIQLRDSLNSVTIENLNVAMQSSKALSLSIQHGTVDDLAAARRIALTANVSYDLGKLWPVVHPMLITPGEPDPYADVQAGGAFQKTFTITGSYPATLPFEQAIAQLQILGDVAVGSFSHSGLAITNLDVPITMGHGMLATIFPGKPAGQNTAPPATANSGQLDVGNLFIDLTRSPPRLSSATPAMAVLKNVTVNPLFAQTYLAKIINNPVFAGAQQASGLFTLYLDRCVNLPMGNLVTQRISANDGQANLRFTLTNLNIGVQGLGEIASALKQDSFTANVNDGTVAIAKGFATQHMVFNTGSYNITFDGKVALDTEQLMPLTVTLPGNRLARAVSSDPNVLKYMPDEVTVVMTGTLNHPQVQMDQVLRKLLANAAKKAAIGNITGLLGGNGSGAAGGSNGADAGAATSQPAGSSDNNPLGALLNGLQKKQKNR